ncbi:MAG TPA: hypothetical protein DCZ43_09190 [candidate division Zixibacteria bacterium]|jgi:hypothetical protein|nr:hypothetical protein [candidate division Zixibacteria bacterium]
MRLYHYTSEANYQSIIRSKTIMPSNPWTTMDSAYGTGFYFTDLGPNKCEMLVMSRCWNNINVSDRVQYYLEFEVDLSLIRKCRDNVYVVENWDTTLIQHIKGGHSETCNRKPCISCERAKPYLSK